MGRSLDAVAADLNAIGDYLAQRDLEALAPEALQKATGAPQADLLLLFGGSIPYGCQVAAQAFQAGLARRFMVAGGQGHTTDHLRGEIPRRYPAIPTAGRMEAEVIADYLREAHGLDPASLILEVASTNCGENVIFARQTLEREPGGLPGTVLVMQDASMQRRMAATFEKEWAGLPTRFVHYAPYRAEVAVREGHLTLEPQGLWGLWSLARWVELLLGEIPRLRDDAQGYGPKGRGYIAHVEIPPEVQGAFDRLQSEFAGSVRRPWEG